MNTLQVILNKEYKVIYTSSVSSDRLVSKAISEIKLHPKKQKGSFKYKKMEHEYVKNQFEDMYLVSIYDVSELESLKKSAWIDELTGVYNRQAYKKIVESLAHDVVRSKRSLGIIFIDLDNLKSINTNLGYVGGDNAISQVAKIADKTVRKSDAVIRYGGDEFVVVSELPGDGLKSIESLGRRLAKAIERETKPKNTASIGGVALNTTQAESLVRSRNFRKSWTEIVKQVDKQVRISKTSGKNQANVAWYS